MRNYKLNEMKLSKHLKVRACLYKTAKIGLVSLMIVGTNLSPILTLAEETQSVVQTDNSEASASIIEAPSVATVSEEPTPLSPDNQESAVSPIETPSAPVISKAPALSTKMDEHLTDVSSVPETAPTALNDEAMVTVTSQTGENFVVRASHIEEDVKNQLVERYDLFLTPELINEGRSDVRELIDVSISAAPDAANAGQIHIGLRDNNGVDNVAYHTDGEIYYAGHGFGGCTYVDTSRIPLDKYQTGDIIDPSDYDASSRFIITGDRFNGSSSLPAGVELEPEVYAIADFHGNFMKTPYYGFGNSVHIFPGFLVKKETIIPLPPINLHFLIDNTEVWSETTLTEWAALSPTLDEDQEVWDYLRTQNPSATTIDPFLNYGQWTLDFDYKPGTFEVSDVYLKMTTTEKSADDKPVITAPNQDYKVGDSIDPLKNVTASDKENGTTKVTVAKIVDQDGKVIDSIPNDKAGKYTVTYTTTDADGNTVTKDATISVRSNEKPGNGTDNGNPSSNQPGNPSQPSNATNNGVIDTSTNIGSKVNNGAVNSPELPQTGENNRQSQTMSFIGVLLAMFGSLLGFLGIKKRRND